MLLYIPFSPYRLKFAFNSMNTLFLHGSDGAHLLRAIRAIWDDDVELAKEILLSPAVIANASESLGIADPNKNMLSLLLLKDIYRRATTAESSSRIQVVNLTDGGCYINSSAYYICVS